MQISEFSVHVTKSLSQEKQTRDYSGFVNSQSDVLYLQINVVISSLK